MVSVTRIITPRIIPSPIRPEEKRKLVPALAFLTAVSAVAAWKLKQYNWTPYVAKGLAGTTVGAFFLNLPWKDDSEHGYPKLPTEPEVDRLEMGGPAESEPRLRRTKSVRGRQEVVEPPPAEPAKPKLSAEEVKRRMSLINGSRERFATFCGKKGLSNRLCWAAASKESGSMRFFKTRKKALKAKTAEEIVLVVASSGLTTRKEMDFKSSSRWSKRSKWIAKRSELEGDGVLESFGVLIDSGNGPEAGVLPRDSDVGLSHRAIDVIESFEAFSSIKISIAFFKDLM